MWGAIVLAALVAAQSPQDTAWNRALVLSAATYTERVQMKPPRTYIVPAARFYVARYGYERVCGEASRFWEQGDTPTATPVIEVRVYVRPGETKLLGDVLTHEYLHAIYFYLDALRPGFGEKHPDNETWVRSLIKVDCPLSWIYAQ